MQALEIPAYAPGVCKIETARSKTLLGRVATAGALLLHPAPGNHSNPRISSSSSVPARRRGLALKDLGLPQRVQSGRRHRAQPRLPLPRRLVPVLLPRDEMGLPRPRLPRLQPAREGGKRYCAVRDPAQPPSPCPGPRCCSGRGPLPDSPPSRSPHTRLTGLATRAGAMPTDHRASSG